MAIYVMLSRFTRGSLKRVHDDPDVAMSIRTAIELHEGEVLTDFVLLGEYDHCAVFRIPDNPRALQVALESEVSQLVDADLMPAIDLPLFQRLVSQTTETAGPHKWQISAWATLARQALRYYALTKYVHRYCKPMTIVGREHFGRVKGPCIVVGNHSSHMDYFVLFYALPERIKWRILTGAAADRWFLQGRKGMEKQPWWFSLAIGAFPIQRGGGSKTLDYAKWLLDQGWNLCIFPEGTRATSRHLGRFRHGVAILALEKNVPVVPIYMSGLREMRPKGTALEHTKPGPATAEILEPIHFPAGTSVPDATRMIFGAMNAAHVRTMQQREHAPVAGVREPARA